MSSAQIRVIMLADAMMRHRLLCRRDAGIARRSCQAFQMSVTRFYGSGGGGGLPVAITPVGIPRSVVINEEYPKPETMVDANVIKPPFGIF